jgi:hypothetical protein
VSEGMPPVANETEALAWVVLQTANRTQAKGSRVRIVVPRAPEVAHEVGAELPEARLVEVEGYLYLNGYVERVEMGLSGGTYTITPAGFEWLEGGMPEEPPSSAKDPVRELAQRPSEEAAFGAALRVELEEESRRMEAFERELDEAGQLREGPPGASWRAAQGPRGTAEPHPVTVGAREDTEKRQQQGRMPRRLRRELNEAARKHLEEERPWWRRVFGR